MTFFSGGNGGTERGGEGPRTPQPAPGGARVPTPRPLCTPGARSLSLCHTSSPRRGLCVCAQSLQLRPALRDPVGRSPPGSAVRGIFQARILEWVAVPSSRGSSRPRDGTQVSCTAGRRFTAESPGRPWRGTHTREPLSSLATAAVLAPAQLRGAGSRISGGWVSAGL